MSQDAKNLLVGLYTRSTSGLVEFPQRLSGMNTWRFNKARKQLYEHGFIELHAQPSGGPNVYRFIDKWQSYGMDGPILPNCNEYPFFVEHPGNYEIQ
ncbi:hypothetical protein [Paenibacillus sp. BK720]|uniref:hypothetical protein n=1 Tax=Paenibacillus sp. BK720 TaxID=2587092 RepID=UPI001ABB7BDF|nr:hypothetical protein [Paenibacillus sp. BK720]